MNKKLFLILWITSILNAQDLQTSIQEVIQTNPIILERLKNYTVIKEDITGAQSAYYPKLDISLGLGYERSQKEDYTGNSTLTKEGNSVKTLGLDVYQNALSYTQNLFNGFGTTYKVRQQEHRTTAAAYSYIEKVNDTSFNMVNTYLEVIKNQELLQTAKANVDITEDIFIKVQKLYDSGLTTLSEVNKIESSLALARANYVVEENTLLDVTYNMKKVLGRFLDPTKMLRPIFNTDIPTNLEEASQFAMQNNPSLLVASSNIKLAQAIFKEKKAPYYPSLDIEISQSLNKNLSAIEGTDDRFRAMAYIRYNIFNGFADSSALQQTRSRVHQEVESKNDLRRQVLEGLELSWAANEKRTIQLKHLEDYKEFSFKTLTLYSKEYDLGRRSLLDLLSAQNDFIAAKSEVIKTSYSILFSKYRILDALGILVLSLTGSTDNIYASVGLNGVVPKNQDTLPVGLDRDKDLIVDEKDICSNSLPKEMKGIYGCRATFTNTKQIERYNGFLFSKDATLSNESKEKLHALIKQVKNFGWSNLHFDVLANVDEDTDEKTMFHLSEKRANVVKDILLQGGALEKNITIHAQSNKAPLYTTEVETGRILNNRVDIVVRKLK
ncbi:MAG: TolC family outer membrane protein [Sulfurimonas sp.]|nr:TolC family outer membrane protein [Sulfurimonas sp.]PHQ88519.1 MAG: type I secretion protein TolC [Sulfurimonas sp.]